MQRLTTAVCGSEQDGRILVQVVASGGIFLAHCRAGKEGIQAAKFAKHTGCERNWVVPFLDSSQFINKASGLACIIPLKSLSGLGLPVGGLSGDLGCAFRCLIFQLNFKPIRIS